MGNLNITGYQTTTLSDKILTLQTVFQQAFGTDIDLNLYSPQGQLINWIATLWDNEDKLGLNFFQSLDYHNATGIFLSLIAITKGQPRNNGTIAVITTTFTSTEINYTIPANSLFQTTDTGIQFTNTSDINIITLNQTVILESIIAQQTNITIGNTLTAIDYFPILNNISVTSIIDGTNIETDVDLINRLDTTDTETGMNDDNAVRDKLRLVANVSKVSVFDNDSNLIVNGVPAHNLFCQVVGGNSIDIANAIFANKASGTPTYGSTNVIVTDSDGFTHPINYEIPSLQYIYVKITITQRENNPIDTSQFDNLKIQTQNYINNLQIGNDVSYTAIFGIWATQNFNISNLSLSYDDITYVSTDLIINFTQYAYMDTTDKITVITL
jgi:hypothetical protein